MNPRIVLCIFFFTLLAGLAGAQDTITFTSSLRADWTQIDRPNVYDYAPTAMDDGQWEVWTCGENFQGGGQDAVFFTSFTTSGAYDVPPTIVISPQSSDASHESQHVCAPSIIKHATSLIEDGREYLFLNGKAFSAFMSGRYLLSGLVTTYLALTGCSPLASPTPYGEQTVQRAKQAFALRTSDELLVTPETMPGPVIQTEEQFFSTLADVQDAILEEHFDTDLSQWTIMMEEAPDDISIASAPAYGGSGAVTLDYQNPQKYLYLMREFPSSTDILVRIFFYDNLDSTLGSIFEITDSAETYETGLGLVTSLYPDTYALRINTFAGTKDTGIPRSEGWHMFEFIVTGSGTYAKIDNIMVSESNPLQIDAGAVHLVATWELTGESTYDELSVVKADTRPWKDLAYDLLGTYYDTYKDTDFSGLYPTLGLANYHSNDLRSLIQTASNFYIYGKHTGNQEAVNRGKQLFLDAYTHAHWDNTNDWARGIYSACFTRAAYIMWDELDSATRQGTKQIIFDQAAHYLNRMPEGGHVFDTKAEENAWHADFLATVVNLFPDVPNKALLEDKGKCFAYHSITNSTDPAYCGLTTQTVYDDFTLENHGLVNPVYASSTLHLLGSGAMAYELAGRPVPWQFKHNAPELYDNFLAKHIDYNTFFPKDTPSLDWSGAHNTLYEGAFTFGYAAEPLGYTPGFTMDDFMSKRSIFFNDIVSEWHRDGPPSAIEYFDQTQTEHSSYRWFLNTVEADLLAWAVYMLDFEPFDLDNDGDVDINDVLMLAGHWGETSGGTGDLNSDRKVNIRDLVLLARNIDS